MGWDSSRPVNWRQLFTTWLIYAAIMSVIFFFIYRDQPLVGIIGGLLFSLPLFLLVGYAMAKFGYQRTTWKDIRSGQTAKRLSADPSTTTTVGGRPKPAPTKRTGGGTPSRKAPPRKRR